MAYTAEILAVGTELLLGGTANTDAQIISRFLAELGITVHHHVVVGDNPERMIAAVEQARSRADILITTGGMGPTYDDITKDIVCRCFGKELVMDEAALETLKARFRAFGREMTPNNLKQAMFPVGSIILPNEKGTAPGCIVEGEGGKACILLPGPPRELFPMFTNSVMPYLEKRAGHKLYTRELRIFGKGESSVEYELRDLIEGQTNPTIATYAKTGEVTLRVTARCQTPEEGEGIVMPVVREIISRFGDIVYSIKGEELAEVVAKLLVERDRTLGVAESCTGGMVASTLVDVPGCSEFLMEGAVTYSDAAKMRRLGVNVHTLRQFGAVSAETAKEMAVGMRRTSGADYAIATTGIAGPDGGTKEKPVGLVYIALAGEHTVQVKELHLTGDRARIRHTTVLNVLDLLRRELLKKTEEAE